MKDRITQEFNEWAFGKDYRDMKTLNKMKAWNRRHGKKLKLSEEGNILKDLEEMLALWDEINKRKEKNVKQV